VEVVTDWEELDLKIRLIELHQANTNNAYGEGLITAEKYRDCLIREQDILVDLMKKLNMVK
jgi:hypothetical protein